MTADTGRGTRAVGYGRDMGSETEVGLGAVRVITTSGALTIIAEDRSDIDTDADVSWDGSVATISSTSDRVTVRVPEGVDVAIGSTSGKVRIRGRLAAVAVSVESGGVEVERAASADVRSRSGRVQIGSVEGTCRVSANSGRVVIERCGGAEVTTRSGRITIRSSTGPVRAHCVQGGIDVGMAVAADVDADTVSGRITVTLPAGSAPQVVGAVPPPDIEGPFDCLVRARSVSGRVSVSIG